MRTQVVCTHAHTGQQQLRSPLWELCPSPLTWFVSNLPPTHRIDFSIWPARGPAFELDYKQRSTMLSVFVSVHGVKFGRPCFFAFTDSDTVWMLTCLLYWTIRRGELIKQKLRKQLGFQCKLVIVMGLCLLKFLNSEIISAFQRTYNAWRNSPRGSSVLSLSCCSFS